jgi:hypothetical protein
MDPTADQPDQAIDPNYRFESLGPSVTLQGQINQLNGLRFDRAEAFMRVKGELRPLQVESLRFIQGRVDRAYDSGLKLLRAGKLKVRLSEQEALGNYIDAQVRAELRERYNIARIDWAGEGPVRVNRREHYSSASELTFRIPDARFGKVIFDMTLTLKTLRTPQVRDFFYADFRPSHLVVIRPSQLGSGHTYVIPRPETK